MSTIEDRPPSQLDRLVARLEQDIRQRGLHAGDRYLTASEAANILGTSTATAQRAMQRLSRRGMLVRRPNLGTFIGPHFEIKHKTMIRTVYVIAPPVGLQGETGRLEAVASGLRAQLQDVNVTLCTPPQSGATAYVKELIQSAFAAGKVAGVVPFSCPREVYRQLSDTGAPTVILGTPYSDEQDIPSIDVDNRMAGRLLIEYLAGRGHRRMTLISAVEGRPGDCFFHDGLSEALTEAQLPHNSLILRIAPLNVEAVESVLDDLFTMDDKPTALIARTPVLARLAAEALKRSQRPAARSCEIVYQSHAATELTIAEPPPFTRVEPTISLRAMANQAGDMLERIEKGEPVEPLHIYVPIELIPKSSS